VRRILVACGLIVSACSSGLSQTTVYSTGFESPGFAPGPVVNQSGWTAELAGTTLDAQVQAGSANTGSQALKITANPSTAAGGWVFYDPIEIAPVAANTPLVTAEFSMFIKSSAAQSGGWGMDVFSTNINFMASWQVDLNNQIRAQDGSNGFVASANTVARDTWNRYKLEMNFVTNRYSVAVNDELFHNNLTLTLGSGIIGDFDFRHSQQIPANDFALFDDFSVTVGVPVPAPIEWGNPLGGSWNTPTDWIGGLSPSGTTAIAKLGTAISTPRTISLSGGTVTIDQLQITSPVGYTLSGIVSNNPWTLRLAGTTSTGLAVSAGSHEFNTNVLIDKDATFEIADGAQVRFRQNFLAPARTLTKTGGGTMRVREIRDAALVVNGGTLQLTAGGTFVGTSVLTAVTVADGTLDIGSSTTGVSSKVLIDYIGTSPIQALRATFAGGRIVDSLNADPRKAIGYAEASSIGLTLLDGTTPTPTAVDGTAILLRTTFKGDTDLNGSVNLDDFTALAGAFGSTAAVWRDGDFGYDGVVSLDDFTDLAANFGLTQADLARQTAVPEPFAPLAAAAASLGLLHRRRF